MKSATFTHRRQWISGLLSAALLLLAGAVPAEEKFQFQTHPFFKHLIGEWSSEGERKYADGRVVKVRQEWKTELLGENALVMEGTQERDGQSSSYKWTFTHADSGLIEAMYQRDVSKPDTQRYEVLVSEDYAKMEMTALLDNNAKATTTYGFKGDDHDTLESKISRTDSAGATIYEGTAVGKRKPS